MANYGGSVTTAEGFEIESSDRTQEQLDSAHKPAEKPAEKAPPEPGKPAEATPEKKATEEPAHGAQTPPETKPEADEDEKLDPADRRKKVQDRIDRITRERRAEERARVQAERERDEIRVRAEANEAELKKLREKFPDAFQKADHGREPNIAEFEDVEDYKAAFRNHVLAQAEQERETTAKQETTRAARRERMEAFRAKIFEPATADPALLEGLPRDLVDSVPLSALKDTDKVTFGNFLMETLTRVREPWMVLNYFKTPNGQTEFQRLSTLHPSEVTMEIGMLYKGLSGANQTAPPEKPKPEISKAKPPGKAISSGPPSDTDPYAPDIDFDEAAKRELALKRRR